MDKKEAYYRLHFKPELSPDELVEYIIEHHPDPGNHLDEELEDYFEGLGAVLKNVPIDSITEGHPDINIQDEKKQSRYNNRKSLPPPIVVWLGSIEDGNHRYRAEKAKGSTDIWIYEVNEHEDDEE